MHVVAARLLSMAGVWAPLPNAASAGLPLAVLLGFCGVHTRAWRKDAADRARSQLQPDGSGTLAVPSFSEATD